MVKDYRHKIIKYEIRFDINHFVHISREFEKSIRRIFNLLIYNKRSKGSNGITLTEVNKEKSG